MAQKFVIGDIVKLKSGGPAMTVTEATVQNNGRLHVQCIWYIAEKYSRESFDSDALTVVVL